MTASRELLVVREAAQFRQAVVDRLRELGADLNVTETTTPDRGGRWGVTLVHPVTGVKRLAIGESRVDVLEYIRDAAADLLEEENDG